MVDFSKLTRPKSTAAPIDPIEIFKKTPNLGDAPNDLWKGQAEALTLWHKGRSLADNVVILNTGAGKSIVGVLIAQSLVNEEIGPVVYACSTIDLAKQTERECERIGLKFTSRISGAFSNDLFATGKAFCITTYAALFAPITGFTKERAPAAVVFDDAHVSERLIRDALTLHISKTDYSALYGDLIDVVRPEFEALGKGQHLNFILEDVGQAGVTLCPPATAFRHRAEIIEMLKKHDYKNKESLFFPVVHLYEHIGMCAIFLSSGAIEITPPFIPTTRFEFLGPKVRRVYLSATLDYETDFVRGFGVRKAHRIEPDNDAGNGERLILLGNDLANPEGQKELATTLSTKNKVLVAVPSYTRAKRWSDLVVPPGPKDFTDQLNQFRQAKKGMFCLVSRVDGIDLPQDTCRIMLVDGAPTGSSLMEKYLFSTLGMTNLFSTKFSSRLTQLFGRINRGRSDYGAFLLYGNDLNVWLKNERNIALLPELLRKQVILGQSMQNDLGPVEHPQAVELVDSVLFRDKGWLQFYRDTIDGLEVSNDAIERVKARESQLAIGAEAECRFMSKLWEGDIDGARKPILDVLNDIAIADAKLAGWYSIWLGMTYEIEGDDETSGTHYRRARSRLSNWVNLPFKKVYKEGEFTADAKTAAHERLLSVNNSGPQALSDYIARIRAQINSVANSAQSSNQHEEAVRYVGELLGFSATRPDNELGMGPDVIWFDDTEKYLVAFELKTKKTTPADYTKDEVGQSLNHLQWIDENFKDYKSDGIFMMGPDGTCKANANPSDRIFHLTMERFHASVAQYLAQIEDVRGRTALERWTILNEMGQLPEWQLKGWFNRLRDRLLRDLKPQ
ncbi:DEAD/DEAH box helicase family protein [Mesorhizobium sp.]|uniref:DEAD/DEAH box helicase family protein n=1 Tax=Mesorhizobium sp. TaxID=1871066 RepID=UPI0011F6FFD1|nr:DEAD/DEAH box helicase family protein [Mesorhizobium sp.]TIS90604.1 MAG: helicase [Mesorhizobium sp.]